MAKTVSLEQEARQVVETACAQMIDCPCGCNREATTALFSEMPDEELLFDVADLFKAFSDTTRIKILFALMGGPSSVTGITEAIRCPTTTCSPCSPRASPTSASNPHRAPQARPPPSPTARLPASHHRLSEETPPRKELPCGNHSSSRTSTAPTAPRRWKRASTSCPA